MRTVILHGHIFKNAGTTFDWSLKRNFGDKFCDHRNDLEMREGGSEYLESFFEKNSEIVAISSHHLNFPIPHSEKYKLIFCYLLRNPISRIRSVYNFERQQKSDSLGARAAKKLSFLEYALWRMRDDVPNTIRNYQTAYLSKTQSGRKRIFINDHDYTEAAKVIDHNPFVGLVDRYDESMVVLESHFQRHDIEIDLAHKPQNVMDNSALTENEKMIETLDELGTEANYVLSKNLYDYRMYRKADIKLTERISRIKNFDDKLLSFKKRCTRL
ncbi:MAG: hypothetical protein ACJAYC_000201 [Halieaceae bacterium]|jgi:hypothetical protein